MARELGGPAASPPKPGFACPCCRYLTLSEPPPGTFEICPVCFWEADEVQARDPEWRGGANGISLREAQATFEQHRVSELRFRGDVREPHPHEVPSEGD